MDEFEQKKYDEAGAARVRIYDFNTRTISTIPAAELAPGMIEARANGIEGTVWVDGTQLKMGSFQHPPFPSEIRDLLRTIQSNLDEVYPMSLEAWEDGFRRDRTPHREIAYWSHLSEIYSRLTATETGEENLQRRYDIFRVLAGCGISSREQVLSVVDRGSLSREEAQAVVDAFYKNAA